MDLNMFVLAGSVADWGHDADTPYLTVRTEGDRFIDVLVPASVYGVDVSGSGIWFEQPVWVTGYMTNDSVVAEHVSLKAAS